MRRARAGRSLTLSCCRRPRRRTRVLTAAHTLMRASRLRACSFSANRCNHCRLLVWRSLRYSHEIIVRPFAVARSGPL